MPTAPAAPSLFNADETFNAAGNAAEVYLAPHVNAAYAAELARVSSHRIAMARVTRMPVAAIWDILVADIGLSAILELK